MLCCKKSNNAIRSIARSHSKKAEIEIAEKLMITFTKFYVCTLSSQPNCLELVPVELSFLQTDASVTYQTMRVSQKFIRCPNNRPRSRTALLATDHMRVITQGMFHHDKRVIQKLESALGTMLNDVSLSSTQELLKIMRAYSRTSYRDQTSCV